ELVVEGRKPGQRTGDEAGAMIAAPAGDDLLFPRPAEYIVVIPDEFDGGFVGVRSAEAKIDLRHVLRRPLEHHLCQGDRGFGAMADIGMVIGEFLRLRRDRLGNLRTTIADIDTV